MSIADLRNSTPAFAGLWTFMNGCTRVTEVLKWTLQCPGEAQPYEHLWRKPLWICTYEFFVCERVSSHGYRHLGIGLLGHFINTAKLPSKVTIPFYSRLTSHVWASHLTLFLTMLGVTSVFCLGHFNKWVVVSHGFWFAQGYQFLTQNLLDKSLNHLSQSQPLTQ